jgi:hypothetical protein
MAVHAVERLYTHAKESSRLPFVDARLHEPRCCRMAQRMRASSAVELRSAHGTLEGGFDGFHGATGPFDDVIADGALGRPSPKMRKQTRWDGNRRLALFRLRLAFGTSVIEPPLNVNE